MNYESTITKDAQACAGVRYTFRRMSEGMRIELRRKLAAAFARLRDLAQDREDLDAAMAERLSKPIEQITMAELTPAERARLARILDEQALVQECDIQPGYFDAAFVAVEGLTIDGIAPDGALLRAAGPPNLVREITEAILAESMLTPAERENFGLPTTSGAQVDGPTTGTAAPHASGSDSTSGASAASTSPAQP